MLQGMKKYWWLILVRGSVAVLFGFFTLFNLAITALALALPFGIYAVVNGGITLGLALFGGGHSNNRLMLDLQGVLSMLFGVRVLTWPGMSMLSLLLAMISFALVSGIVEIVAAFQSRHIWLGLSGLIAVLFGLYAICFPGDGALAVLLVIGSYAIGVGLMLVAQQIGEE